MVIRGAPIILDPTSEMMAWCNEEEDSTNPIIVSSLRSNNPIYDRLVSCPSCGHQIELYNQSRIHDLPGLPAGVKFDPTDQEILEHLEAKIIMEDGIRPHPLIDEFIPTLEGDNGICYTHPEKLPGVSKDGQVRHFFHRPSKAYTTGTRKRRKVHSSPDERIETRWHKTGKTRPILMQGQGGQMIKGFKKILVLYTNYGRQKKPEKTSWVMHQYHLGNCEEEKDGELVVSKVFYQTQPRQSSSSNKYDTHTTTVDDHDKMIILEGSSSHEQLGLNCNKLLVDQLINYEDDNSIINPSHYVYYVNQNQNQNDDRSGLISSFPPPQLIPNFVGHSHSREDIHQRLVGN